MTRIFLTLLLVLAVSASPILAANPTTPWAGQLFNSDTYSNISGFQLSFTGIVTGSGNLDDSIQVNGWKGFGGSPFPSSGYIADGVISGTEGDDYYNGWWLVDLTTSERRLVSDWDASSGLAITSSAFSTALTSGDAVAMIHPFIVPQSGTIIKEGLTGTAAADSLECFTAVGNVWLNGLSLEVTTGAGSTSELANFVIGLAAGTGTGYTRVGLGKDLNGLAAGVIEYVDPKEVLVWAIAADTTVSTKTPVLTDSLGYTRASVQVVSPQLARRDWRILIPDGHKVKLLLPGSSTATVVNVSAQWSAAEGGAYLRK